MSGVYITGQVLRTAIFIYLYIYSYTVLQYIIYYCYFRQRVYSVVHAQHKQYYRRRRVTA